MVGFTGCRVWGQLSITESILIFEAPQGEECKCELCCQVRQSIPQSRIARDSRKLDSGLTEEAIATD